MPHEKVVVPTRCPNPVWIGLEEEASVIRLDLGAFSLEHCVGRHPVEFPTQESPSCHVLTTKHATDLVDFETSLRTKAHQW